VDTQSEAFILKSRCFPSLRGFFNDLPYKSDEMAHVAFPDERDNKPKLTSTRRDEFEMLSTCKLDFSE